ncbi:hypothetical protein [Salinibacter grassmerensis]|uniref:hypothetical protein n=1 Tax=Salinibacter grassmerensis TaxID=3040353 RepID=UPI0021E91375|nr:hypothetical protein [Salinibacter grassmerensis]
MNKWKAAKNQINNLINKHLESLTDSEAAELCRLKKLAAKQIGESPQFLYEQAIKVADTTYLYDVELAAERETVKKAIPLDAVVRFLRDKKEQKYLIKRQGEVVSTGTEFVRHQ